MIKLFFLTVLSGYFPSMAVVKKLPTFSFLAEVMESEMGMVSCVKLSCVTMVTGGSVGGILLPCWNRL
jgi:hypothetical protein